MKHLIQLLIIPILLSSCSKNNNSTGGDEEIITGTYTGSLSEVVFDKHTLNFKVKLTKLDSKKYSISKISSGDLPDFSMEEKLNQPNALIYCQIPLQIVGGKNIIGSGQTVGSYDFSFNKHLNTIEFGVVIGDPNMPEKLFFFEGVKE